MPDRCISATVGARTVALDVDEAGEPMTVRLSGPGVEVVSFALNDYLAIYDAVEVLNRLAADLYKPKPH